MRLFSRNMIWMLLAPRARIHRLPLRFPSAAWAAPRGNGTTTEEFNGIDILTLEMSMTTLALTSSKGELTRCRYCSIGIWPPSLVVYIPRWYNLGFAHPWRPSPNINHHVNQPSKRENFSSTHWHLNPNRSSVSFHRHDIPICNQPINLKKLRSMIDGSCMS